MSVRTVLVRIQSEPIIILKVLHAINKQDWQQVIFGIQVFAMGERRLQPLIEASNAWQGHFLIPFTFLGGHSAPLIKLLLVKPNKSKDELTTSEEAKRRVNSMLLALRYLVTPKRLSMGLNYVVDRNCQGAILLDVAAESSAFGHVSIKRRLHREEIQQ